MLCKDPGLPSLPLLMPLQITSYDDEHSQDLSFPFCRS